MPTRDSILEHEVHDGVDRILAAQLRHLGERLARERLERVRLELDEQHAVGEPAARYRFSQSSLGVRIACAIFLRVAGSRSRL